MICSGPSSPLSFHAGTLGVWSTRARGVFGRNSCRSTNQDVPNHSYWFGTAGASRASGGSSRNNSIRSHSMCFSLCIARGCVFCGLAAENPSTIPPCDHAPRMLARWPAATAALGAAQWAHTGCGWAASSAASMGLHTSGSAARDALLPSDAAVAAGGGADTGPGSSGYGAAAVSPAPFTTRLGSRSVIVMEGVDALGFLQVCAAQQAGRPRPEQGSAVQPSGRAPDPGCARQPLFCRLSPRAWSPMTSGRWLRRGRAPSTRPWSTQRASCFTTSSFGGERTGPRPPPAVGSSRSSCSGCCWMSTQRARAACYRGWRATSCGGR
jgi:hypothetical protein